MNNENYSPDEIRLLDEFANVALRSLVTDDSHDEDCAILAYGQAEAMIAERRKRVPAQHIESTPPADGDDQLSDDELTENNINGWRECATVAPERGDSILCEWEIDRAVALMREGLRYRCELEARLQLLNAERLTVAELQRALANGADDLRAADAATTLARQERDEAKENSQWMQDRITEFRSRAEQAEAAIDAAQPVLDAVVQCHSDKTPFMNSIAAGKLLDAYADRRRNEERAKQQGGA
jgi:hypothetical protein